MRIHSEFTEQTLSLFPANHWLKSIRPWVIPSVLIALVWLMIVPLSAQAQSATATSITGTVVDPSGAIVPNATVAVRNPVSGYSRTAVTDASGKFAIANVPFNPYHVTVTA